MRRVTGNGGGANQQDQRELDDAALGPAFSALRARLVRAPEADIASRHLTAMFAASDRVHAVIDLVATDLTAGTTFAPA